MSRGRAALQKRITALLRKIEKCTPGVLQAWEDTFIHWESLTKQLTSHPRTKLEDGQIAETFHRSVAKRRASHQSSEHELEVCSV
jgi:neurofibromin 1